MNFTYGGREFVSTGFDLEGIEKLCKSLDAIGKSPQKAANKASSKAASIVKRSIRARAPKKTGTLKRAIVIRAEKSKLKGKKVRQITFSKSSSADLQKPIKRPGLYGGKHRSWGYVPASLEYGFLTRAKGGGIEYHSYGREFTNYGADLSEWYRKYGNSGDRSLQKTRAGRKRDGYLETVKGYQSRKVEGRYYMKKGAEAVESQVQRAIVETAGKELDALWQKAAHK